MVNKLLDKTLTGTETPDDMLKKFYDTCGNVCKRWMPLPKDQKQKFYPKRSKSTKLNITTDHDIKERIK